MLLRIVSMLTKLGLQDSRVKEDPCLGYDNDYDNDDDREKDEGRGV